MLLNAYLKLLLSRPLVSMLLVLGLSAGLIYFVPQFRMDASSDSLVVEGDPDLEYSREVTRRFGSMDFVFIVFTPEDELFTEQRLEQLRGLRDEISQMERIEGIESIFTVPLFGLGDMALTDLDPDSLLTLESPDVDLMAAKQDLMSSQAYRNALISEDGRTASLVVNFVRQETLYELLDRRTELRRLRDSDELSPVEAGELREVSRAYDQEKIRVAGLLHEDITTIRSIIDRYRDGADIVMGGVPMIADDLITFVKSDLVNFGTALVAFIILSLSYLFRKLRYVLVPIFCCTIIALSVTGLLGLLEWPVTVISSNFISLLLIISISLNVHLMVRYRELQQQNPDLEHRELLHQSLQNMFKPCLYTSLTTMVAFGSLVISDIPPIVDFGWMMVTGILLAFVLTFSLFPSIMAQLPKPALAPQSAVARVTPALAGFTLRRGNFIVAFCAMLLLASVAGMSRLQVENSFINYFDSDTEIYRGMVKIDQSMGGTTPVDVLVTMSRPNPFDAPAADDEFADDEWDDGGWDEWDEEGEAGGDDSAYWFTSDKMARIIDMHDYLESFDETGKVLSLATLLKIAYELNDGQPLNSIELGVLYNRIPDEYKDSLLSPYVSVPDDQVRFAIRVNDTDPDLVRNELIQEIRAGMQERFDLNEDQVRLSGMLILYNNMLQSLFESQILTLSVVLLVIMLMFMALFRSWKLALIGIVPNILAAALVLGIMGWAGIPLDMMTITIAAISVGIGVDNTIHYIHRFRSSFAGQEGDYRKTLEYSHGSIGQAMFYTGFTIVAGFSILVLSNFVPTIFFGLLISLAMIVALTGALTLLPQLLLMFTPLKQPEGKTGDASESGLR